MKGRIRDLIPYGNKTLLSLELETQAASMDGLSDKDVSVEIKPYRERRSLDANGMLWACIGELASALRADKWDIYLMMLKRYGKYTYILVKPEAVDAMKRSWRECEVVGQGDLNGKTMVQMLCYFGSSTYDSKEFSVLLDGVISEMREVGLQPPASESMMAALEQVEKRSKKHG